LVARKNILVFNGLQNGARARAGSRAGRNYESNCDAGDKVRYDQERVQETTSVPMS